MRIDTQLKSGNSDSRRTGCIPEPWGDWLQAGPSKKTAENAKCRPKGGNSSRGGKWRPEGGNVVTFDMRVRKLPLCNNMLNYEQL